MTSVYPEVYVFSAKKRIIRNSVILAGVFLVAAVGCDRGARHKVLTFFFEGVPPLDSDTQPEDTETTVEESADTAALEEEVAKVARQRRSSRHEPGKDCVQCHREGTRWSEKRLIKPLPDLCYSCHTDYSDAADYLHGPTAAGDCVFCHDPHQARYVHLQRAPQPELCYQCHLQEDIASIADHQDKQHDICTECHDPHMGATMNFLKPPPESKDNSNSVDLSE